MADYTFLGLQPYTEEDAYRFKGRTEESLELFRLIMRNDFTVCYAESGEGKTSLLNAGVFPLLRENMYFPITITFTIDDYKLTPDCFDTIIDRCIKDSIAEYNEKNKGVNVEYKLYSTDFQGIVCHSELEQEFSKYSWWKLRNYKPQAMGLTFTPVFVFDQFEEVFNLPGSIVWTKKFFDWLENVSFDSCPDDIVKKVREIIGDKAAFPTIKEDKGFKAVFSLRKEFIGELDYWGMQKCFIPSLKDNRYCLKALTYEGAKKVMTQQEHFEENKVEQILTYFVGQYSREPEKTIEEDLPVIPALLLSVVCYSWEKDMGSFAELSTAEIGQSLNSVLERFFIQAIEAIVQELSEQSSTTNPDKSRYDLDTAVFALVDRNGKRVRTKTTNTSLSQIDFDVKYKLALSRHRIIKVMKVDGEDYVEIVHDSLCSIIAKRRDARQANETKEREEKLLREQARKMRKRVFIFSLLAIVLFIFMFIFMWQNNRYLLTQKTLILTEVQKDSIAMQKEMTQKSLFLSEKQKDSIRRQNNAIAYLFDSISKLNVSLVEQIKLNEQKSKKLEMQYQLLVEQVQRSSSFFTSLSSKDSILVSPSTNSPYMKTDTDIKRDGKTLDNNLLTKTVYIKGGKSTKYTFASRGHQELAVVAEPGGLITLKIHVTNSEGLNLYFDDVQDVRKGRQSRNTIIVFRNPKQPKLFRNNQI